MAIFLRIKSMLLLGIPISTILPSIEFKHRRPSTLFQNLQKITWSQIHSASFVQSAFLSDFACACDKAMLTIFALVDLITFHNSDHSILY